MGALAATIPTQNGTVIAPAAVSASDTIDRSIMGPKGCYLKIINGGGSPDTVAISDASIAPSGSPATPPGSAVANGTSKSFHIKPEQVNPATGLVTVTNSFTTSVQYELVPVG